MTAPTKSAARVSLVAVMATAVAMRVWALSYGFTQDEVGWVAPVWMFFQSGEITVNPPLYPGLLNAVFPDGQVIMAGRVVSTLCSLATVAVAWTAGLALSRGSVPIAAAAALWVVFHPYLAFVGGVFRVYACFALVLMWYTSAGARLLDDDAPRHRRGVMVSAAVLPWLHYMGLPIVAMSGLALVVMAPRSDGFRRTGRLFVPAAVGFLPLAVMIASKMAGGRSLFNYPDQPFKGTVTMLELGLNQGHWVALPALVVALWLGKHGCPGRPWLVVVSASVLATASLLGHIHNVRPVAVVTFVIPFSLVCSSIPSAFYQDNAKRVVTAALVLFHGGMVATQYPRTLPPRRCEVCPASPRGQVTMNGLSRVAAEWREYDPDRDGRAVYFHPSEEARSIHLIAAGKLVSRVPETERPLPVLDAFVLDGVNGFGVDEVSELNGLLFSLVHPFEAVNGRGDALTCPEIGRTVDYAVFNCRNVPSTPTVGPDNR